MDVNEPFKTEVVDISTTDHTFTLKVQSIYCNATGTLIVELKGDADGTSRPYEVTQGQVLFGAFRKVVLSGTSAALQAANKLIGQRSADYEEKEGLAGFPGPAA